MTALGTRDRAHGQACIRRAERGVTHFRDRFSQFLGQDCQTVDVGGLALIRTHAQRRIALGVLDRAIAFTGRQFNIAGGDVFLKIDKPLDMGMRRLRHAPHGAYVP